MAWRAAQQQRVIIRQIEFQAGGKVRVRQLDLVSDDGAHFSDQLFLAVTPGRPRVQIFAWASAGITLVL